MARPATSVWRIALPPAPQVPSGFDFQCRPRAAAAVLLGPPGEVGEPVLDAGRVADLGGDLRHVVQGDAVRDGQAELVPRWW
ncbi:hypothetical protein ACGFNV_46510 [Streptomyces sp. NPDC048751]|uniref:hypothetical protein n=1 Tax=Streptomyces sp. NPDC048751 TaxID=3365591 RepID=UPI00371286DC